MLDSFYIVLSYPSLSFHCILFQSDNNIRNLILNKFDIIFQFHNKNKNLKAIFLLEMLERMGTEMEPFVIDHSVALIVLQQVSIMQHTLIEYSATTRCFLEYFE